MLGFMRRHKNKLSLRKPENTSIARIKGFNKMQVSTFYENLGNLYTKYKFNPSRIFNLDETGITTVMDQPKVVAPLGQKQVGQVTSAERGSLITFIGIISAQGNYLPPVYIFPRVRFKDSFIRNTPLNSLGLCNRSGWITSELFLDVLKHIKSYADSKPEHGKEILLIMDNHETHISIPAIKFCRENGIILTLLPHTSNKLQPLDISIYGPFKNSLKAAQHRWMMNNREKTISLYDIGEISAIPFLEAFTPSNILSGFRKSGIYPFNPNAFTIPDVIVEEGMETLNEEQELGENDVTVTPGTSSSKTVTLPASSNADGKNIFFARK